MLKCSCTFYLDGPKVGPRQIYISLHFQGKRLRHYTGHRVDALRWDNKAQQLMRNTLSADGRIFSEVNRDISHQAELLEHALAEAAKRSAAPTVAQVRETYRLLISGSSADKSLTTQMVLDDYLAGRILSDSRRTSLSFISRTFDAWLVSHTYTLSECTRGHIIAFERHLAKKRGNNTITIYMSWLKTLFAHAVRTRRLSETPFENYRLGSLVQISPVCLTKEERDHLAAYRPKKKSLEFCRDLFTFQCHTGVRVGDMQRLQVSNLIDGCLVYIPHKTSHRTAEAVSVPLTRTAAGIAERYSGLDGDRLFPAFRTNVYNAALGRLFKEAGMDRIVTRISKKTQREERVPLHKVASSHMARRTFINILHRNVKNEVIASMTGHVKYSRAFARYYDVGDDSRRDAIEMYLE